MTVWAGVRIFHLPLQNCCTFPSAWYDVDFTLFFQVDIVTSPGGRWLAVWVAATLVQSGGAPCSRRGPEPAVEPITIAVRIWVSPIPKIPPRTGGSRMHYVCMYGDTEIRACWERVLGWGIFLHPGLNGNHSFPPVRPDNCSVAANGQHRIWHFGGFVRWIWTTGEQQELKYRIQALWRTIAASGRSGNV